MRSASAFQANTATEVQEPSHKRRRVGAKMVVGAIMLGLRVRGSFFDIRCLVCPMCSKKPQWRNVNMYVCMYVFMYVCMYLCMYVCIRHGCMYV